jgi:hypothetical protein
MFPDGHPETLLTAPAALKKDLQFARRWAIWVEGYVEKKDVEDNNYVRGNCGAALVEYRSL